jgi:hypothetical protein
LRQILFHPRGITNRRKLWNFRKFFFFCLPQPENLTSQSARENFRAIEPLRKRLRRKMEFKYAQTRCCAACRVCERSMRFRTSWTRQDLCRSESLGRDGLRAAPDLISAATKSSSSSCASFGPRAKVRRGTQRKRLEAIRYNSIERYATWTREPHTSPFALTPRLVPNYLNIPLATNARRTGSAVQPTNLESIPLRTSA